MPDRTKIAILTIFTEGAEKWCRDSEGLLKKLARERDRLDEKEQQLKAELPEQVRGVNAGKNTLLWKKILAEMDYPDTEVAFKMLTGFPVIGALEQTGVFGTRSGEELIVGVDPVWLARMAKQSRETLIKICWKKRTTKPPGQCMTSPPTRRPGR